MLAAPLSSQAGVNSFFNKTVQQSTYILNSSHMFKCFTAFELCSSGISIVDKRNRDENLIVGKASADENQFELSLSFWAMKSSKVMFIHESCII